MGRRWHCIAATTTRLSSRLSASRPRETSVPARIWRACRRRLSTLSPPLSRRQPTSLPLSSTSEPAQVWYPSAKFRVTDTGIVNVDEAAGGAHAHEDAKFSVLDGADYRILDFSLIISPSTATLPYP